MLLTHDVLSVSIFPNFIFPTEVQAFKAWVTLTLTFQCHWRSDLRAQLDAPYMTPYECLSNKVLLNAYKSEWSQIAKESDRLYPPPPLPSPLPIFILSIKTCLEIGWKLWEQTVFNESGMKSTIHMHFLEPRAPDSHPFRSTIIRFQDIAHFRIFPMTPIVKLQVPQHF